MVMRSIDLARECLGTPFRPQGRQRLEGLDCVGLITENLRAAGHSVEEVTDYEIGCSQFSALLLEYVQKQCYRIEEVEAEEGDIALFWVRVPGRPQHMGFISAWGKAPHIIHAPGGGRVSEIPLTENWLKRVHSLWRFKEGQA